MPVVFGGVSERRHRVVLGFIRGQHLGSDGDVGADELQHVARLAVEQLGLLFRPSRISGSPSDGMRSVATPFSMRVRPVPRIGLEVLGEHAAQCGERVAKSC